MAFKVGSDRRKWNCFHLREGVGPLRDFSALFLMVALHASSWSQAAVSNADQQRSQAFEAMMADPENQERSFEFARAAAAAGDLRGAIAALERMLRINPGLANIELELGVLYLRADSPELASFHLRRALASPEIPAPTRDRAASLLSRAERAKTRHLITGSLLAGLRYDNNANAGPDSRLFRDPFSGSSQLDVSDTGTSDSSAELAGSINYVYALDSQAGTELEAGFGVYNRYYNKQTQLNLNSLSLDFGPRFYLGGTDNPQFSVRPYVLATHVVLDGKDYLSSGGIGVNLRRFIDGVAFIDLSLESSDQNYRNSTGSPFNSERSGTYTELRSNVSRQLSASTRVFGGLSLATRDSRVDYETFKEGSLRVGVAVAHPAPFGLTAAVWNTTLTAGWRSTRYEAPDPNIVLNIRRKDARAEVILSTTALLKPGLSMVLSLVHTNNDSTVPNFKYDNTSAALGLAWSF